MNQDSIKLLKLPRLSRFPGSGGAGFPSLKPAARLMWSNDKCARRKTVVAEPVYRSRVIGLDMRRDLAINSS